MTLTIVLAVKFYESTTFISINIVEMKAITSKAITQTGIALA